MNLRDEEDIEKYILNKGYNFNYGYTVYCGEEVKDIGWQWQLMNISDDGILLLEVDIEKGVFTGNELFFSFLDINLLVLEKHWFNYFLTLETKEELLYTVGNLEEEVEIKSSGITVAIRKKVFGVKFQKENIKNIKEFIQTLEGNKDERRKK